MTLLFLQSEPPSHKQPPGRGAEHCLDFSATVAINNLHVGFVGGELQRFAIAVVAAQAADIYMIDEPSSYLDVRQRLKAAQVSISLVIRLCAVVTLAGCTLRSAAHLIIALDLFLVFMLLETVHTRLYTQLSGRNVSCKCRVVSRADSTL